MSTRVFSLLSAAVFVLGVFAASAAADERLKVVVTIFPLYDFARVISGEKADVSMLLPPGVEAHAFEPRPRDIVRLNRADVFIYTGQFMEPWAADVLKGVSNKDLLAVDASTGIVLLDEEDEEGGADADHHHGGKDPHIWLDPVLAEVMVDTIAQSFARKDPSNRVFYQANAESYKAKLKDLDARYAAMLSTCQIRTIIYAGHFAFGYFAKRYKLEHVSPYKGFSPDAEPTPKTIRNIIENIRQTGSRVVYYKELIDPKVGRVLAEETGARLELLHGAHNVAKDELATTTYLSLMEANLKKLKEGLECQ